MAICRKTSLQVAWRDSRSPSEELQLLLLCFAAVFGFGLAAHAYGFLHASFSHDMLNALVADNVETYWKMQLGRPGIVLYRRVFRGLIAAPWQLGVLSLLWLSLSCFLISKLFQIHSSLFCVLTAAILTVNISTIAMTATYLYEMDANLFAVFLGICAVFLWDRGGWAGAFIGSLPVAACMGTYQSMLSVPLTVIMLLSLAALLRGEKCAPVIRKGLRAVMMLGLGAAFYFLAVQLMCSWKEINLALDNYNSVGQAAAVPVFDRILSVYRTWAYAFWNPSRAHIEPPVLFLNILLPLLALWKLGLWFVGGTAGKTEKILVFILLLLLPAGMNTAQISFSRDVHDLMKFSFWFFYILCLLPVFLLPSPRPGPIRGTAAVLTLVLFCSNFQTANIIYTKKALEQDAAFSLMTRVMARLESQEDYLPGDTPVVMVGVSDLLQDRLPGFESYYDITGCEASSPIPKSGATYSYNVYAAFFRYILNSSAQMAETADWNRLRKDPRVVAMPNYPDVGCMQLLDGIMVVKLGSDPLADA